MDGGDEPRLESGAVGHPRSRDTAGAGVVDDVGGSVWVAPDVEAREGLPHAPVAVRLDAVVEPGHRPVVANP